MSIAILGEVYNETRRLAIAGSGLAKGDFRLKKLIPTLEKAGQKSPVFAKVAAAIDKTVNADTKSASAALLELSTLVTAILYTQGSTGTDGELKDIETSGLEIPTANSSARMLKPLIEALTTTGSGRLEIIVDAHSRGAFKDLRLVKPAMFAIDDIYGEVAEFVTESVLPIYGKAILPELRESWDVKGNTGHVRRLQLMNRIDPAGTIELVEDALENGKKDMKIAAIGCLKDSKGHVAYLLEQTKAKARDVRRAAFRAVSKFTENDVVDSLVKALSGADVELVAEPISRNRDPRLLKSLLAEADRQLDAVLTTKDRSKLKTLLGRFCQLLGGFVSREDQKTAAFVKKCFDEREAIGKLKGDHSGGIDINQRVAAIIATSESTTNRKALVKAHESLDPVSLGWAMVAAIETMTPKKVFDIFSPYYTTSVAKKRGRNIAKEKLDVICDTIKRTIDVRRQPRGAEIDGLPSLAKKTTRTKEIKLAPQWLDAAVAAEDLETVTVLARPKHKATNRFLSAQAEKMLAKTSGPNYDLAQVIDTMIEIKHPDAVGYFLKSLQAFGKKTRGYSYAWWVVGMIPKLPKSAAKRIEAILPELNERTIDSVIPYLEALKAK